MNSFNRDGAILVAATFVYWTPLLSCTGGGSPQPLQLWISLGISAKGRSGLQATGQIGTLRETVEEVSEGCFSDNSEQMESEDTSSKLSVNSPVIPVDSASVDKERQHKKAKKKKKKKGHKHGYLTEKPTSSTDHHSAGEKGMDVSFPLSALHRSWGKSKLPSSSKIGGKDLKKMTLWEDESKEDHERKRTVDVTVKSGKRLRYQMEENDEEVVKGRKRSHKEQSSDDENVSVGKPEEVLSAVVQEKEEYSPVFLGTYVVCTCVSACMCTCVYRCLRCVCMVLVTCLSYYKALVIICIVLLQSRKT